MPVLLPAACLLLAALPGVAPADESAVRSSLDEQAAAERAARESQQRIDALDDETRDLLQRYRAALAEAESLERFNAQVERLVASQERELEARRDQLDEIEETNRRVLPHMESLLDTLERFVALDIPFLPEERERRLASLRELMDRADVTVAEKYRRLLEAYSVEMEYGRTIEAYKGTLDTDDGARNVEFLRVGRVALLYQSLDGARTGYWDGAAGRFVRDDSYRDAVRTGLRVARRQAAPDLLTVPVPAAGRDS